MPYGHLGARPTHPRHRRRRHHVAAGQHLAQSGEALRVLLRGHPEGPGGQVHRRDTRRHRLPYPLRVHRAGRRHGHPGAGDQRHPYLEQGGVEGVRGVHQHRVVRAERPVAVPGQRRDTAVRHADALGYAGGAGGVHHVRQVLGPHRRSGLTGRCFRHRRPYLRVVQHDRLPGQVRRDRRASGLGAQHERGPRVGQQERDPLRRIAGVHRHVRRARLPHRQQRRDQPGRPLQHHRDPVATAHPQAAQVRGEAVRPRVQLTELNTLTPVRHGHGIRRGRHACREQFRHGGFPRLSRLRRRGVPLRHGPVPLGRVQDVDPAHRHRRVRHQLLQHPHQPPGQRAGRLGGDQVGPVGDLHLQPVAGEDAEGQRVVGGLAQAERGEGERAGGRFGSRARVVLVHHQRVEARFRAGVLLDVGQAQVLVREQRGLAALYVLEHLHHGLPRVQAHPHRHRVDEEADHGLDAGEFRRAARHGRAVDHVVAPGQPGQEQRPGALHDGVDGQAVAAGQVGQGAGEGRRQVGLGLVGQLGSAGRVGGGDERRLAVPGQFGAPRGPRGVLVLPSQPRQVVAVGGRPPQYRGVAARRVHRGRLVEEDGHRPAVEQDVMSRQHHAVPLGTEAYEQHPQQRRHPEVEAFRARVGCQPSDLGERVGLGQAGQVGLAPGQYGFPADELDRLPRLAAVEAGAERRVPAEQCLPGRVPAVRVQGTVDGQGALDDVDVGSLVAEPGVEEHPFLQRGQRPHLGECRAPAGCRSRGGC